MARRIDIAKSTITPPVNDMEKASASPNTHSRQSPIHSSPPIDPPSQHPTPSSPSVPSIPFTTLIEADHTSLRHLSAAVLLPSIPLSTRLSHLTTLLTRLIRHDISEELVMRPAFATYLGDVGVQAAAQDRRDHGVLKGKLLALYQGLLDDMDGKGVGKGLDEERLLKEVKGLSDEMGMHMQEESGVMLPRFAGVVGREVEIELGRRYARTLVLLPDVRVWDDRGEGEVRRCFAGLLEYCTAEMDVMRDLMRRLEVRAEREQDGGYLQRRVLEELGELRLLGSGSGSGRSRSGGEKL